MENQEAAQKRERKLGYYIAKSPVIFRNKKQLEEYLTKENGLKEGEILVKGSPVQAQNKQVFKIS